VKLAIFDIDGTLLDNDKEEDTCFSHALREVLSLPALDTEWSHYRDVSDDGVAGEAYRAAHGAALPCNLRAATITRFLALLAAHVGTAGLRCVRGAEHITVRLAEHGWAAALATGAWREAAEFKLSVAGIQYATLPFATSEDGPGRTQIVAAAHARAAAAAPAGSFERVVCVGDGVWDVDTARALALPFVGIGSGRRAELLRARGATSVLASFDDPSGVLDALETAVQPLAPVR